ncbi:MAG: translation initiation factor eIF-2B [Candidatus Micrarchaeia archaeon]
MEEWLRIAKDIKDLKIQGASNVAKAGIKAWAMAKNKEQATKILEMSRPTEPMLRNVLHYLNNGGDAKELLKTIDEAMQKIAEYGSDLLSDSSVVYTHCHSSTVEAILKEAKRKGKNFEVHVTETRPDMQGRITAANLARAGIKVTMYVDSAVLTALKSADLMLIGSDAITAYGGIVNKIGSYLFSKIARELETPVYVADLALKFDPNTRYGIIEKIEQRSEKEVWVKHPPAVRIVNNVFDFIPSVYITALITELGIMPYSELLDKVREVYPWISQD